MRLQQALMYYRPHVDDLQYTFPLDFCPIYNSETKEIIHIDIPPVRRPLSKAAPSNYHPEAIEKEGGYRTDLKPIHITQPEGVSFKMNGRIIEWQNWSMHIGFNYREGIVLHKSASATRARSGRSSTGCRWRRWWFPTAIRSIHTNASTRSTWASTAGDT